MKNPCVYILASRRDGVLYVGVTSDLHGRMSEHEQGLREGFTKKHNIKTLVYYEYHHTIPEAIRREKQLKHWERSWKVRLIVSMNPEWVNLYNIENGDISEGPNDIIRPNR